MSLSTYVYRTDEEGQKMLREPFSEELMPYLPDDCDMEEDAFMRIRTRDFENIRELLFEEVLSEQEAMVLCRRYDLDADGIDTLAAIAQSLNLSRERVRQIQRGAERKLKAYLPSPY